MTNLVRAAGLLIFKDTDPVQYLLMKASYPPFHYSPPKGHVDPGEDEFKTAMRETQEESGLSANLLVIDDKFTKVLNYTAHGKPKRVSYWAAKVKQDAHVTISHEHTEFKWVTFGDLGKYIADYADLMQIYKELEDHLKNRNNA